VSASTADTHLVIEPSTAGLECELVTRIEELVERKAKRAARGPRPSASEAKAMDED
jgi:hypothetical protein